MLLIICGESLEGSLEYTAPNSTDREMSSFVDTLVVLALST